MFNFFALMALCATSATANNAIQSATNLNNGILAPEGVLGVVSPVRRCGGVGTPFNLRISGCEGRCQLRPGTIYACEKDFMPSSASASLTLRVEICMSTGFCIIILDTELENSSVQPGFMYTAKYNIVPNDVLSGETVEFKAYILDTDSRLVEICMAAEVDILELGQ